MMTPPDPTPAVSVVMAVHNGLPYLESALRSIMDQSLRDIEIIVVDDASSDDTPAVLARLAEEDPRIRVLTNTENLRLAASLNRGLDIARAPLIARMDADDIAHPDRLSVQKAYMDAHPDVLLSGMSLRVIGSDGHIQRTARRSRDTVATRWLARFMMPLSHPTFLFHARFPDGSAPRYRSDFPVTEDYDFVAELLVHGDAVTLSAVGLDYRVHGASATATKAARQKADARIVAERIQARELAPEIRQAIGPLNAAYLGFEPADPAAVFAGLRRMIAHDMRDHPDHGAWMRRQGAQLALTALRHGGAGRRQIMAAFLGPGRDFLPALALRAAEIANLLPSLFRSDRRFDCT